MMVKMNIQALRFKLFTLLCCSASTVSALRHSFTTAADGRAIIGPVGMPFGFQGGGHYELKVSNFELTSKKEGGNVNGLTPGFYLHRFPNDAAYTKFLNIVQSNASSCSFDYFVEPDDILDDDTMTYEEVGDITSAEHGILLMMKPPKTKWKPAEPTIEYNFQKHEAGLYFLTFQICVASNAAIKTLENVQSSFDLDFHFMNVDASGQYSYLTAGELHLPLLFFFFAMSYLICTICWIMNLRNIGQGGPGLFDSSTSTPSARPVVYPIHKLMAALLAFKFLTVFFESIRYHVIRITGHAELWSVVFYAMNFVKGIFLFTVILLIGTGWSFVKPFLNQGEKRIIFGILVLQVINNVAIAVLSHETTGEKSYEKWNAVLHLVDILCCCAVLLPIVWQVNSLEKSLPSSNPASTSNNTADVGIDEYDLPDEEEMDSEQKAEHDQEKGQILSKLKLFRSFYLLVTAYIYLTRIIVYLFANMLDYQHLWLRHALVEVVTLTFYVVVGILFRPMPDNPYLSVRQEERRETDGIAMTTTRKKGASKS